ncbi:LOW QUALITY PROTEIN: hypothetical protein ACHAXT_000018 [Thalassiosira profunda]
MSPTKHTNSPSKPNDGKPTDAFVSNPSDSKPKNSSSNSLLSLGSMQSFTNEPKTPSTPKTTSMTLRSSTAAKFATSPVKSYKAAAATGISGPTAASPSTADIDSLPTPQDQRGARGERQLLAQDHLHAPPPLLHREVVQEHFGRLLPLPLSHSSPQSDAHREPATLATPRPRGRSHEPTSLAHFAQEDLHQRPSSFPYLDEEGASHQNRLVHRFGGHEASEKPHPSVGHEDEERLNRHRDLQEAQTTCQESELDKMEDRGGQGPVPPRPSSLPGRPRRGPRLTAEERRSSAPKPLEEDRAQHPQSLASQRKFADSQRKLRKIWDASSNPADDTKAPPSKPTPSKQKAKSNSDRPPSPAPKLKSLTHPSNDAPDELVIVDPNDPNFPRDKWNRWMIENGHMVLSKIHTPSVNGEPSGTREAFNVNHGLDFSECFHWLSPQFFFDPYRFDPTELIHFSTSAAKLGAPMNFIRNMCDNPHHAVLSLATGIPGLCKVFHTLRHHYAPIGDDPSDDIKEMTVLEGLGGEAELRQVNPNMSIVATTTATCPTIEYWANADYDSIDPKGIAPCLMAQCTVPASFLIPSDLTECFHRLNLDTIDAGTTLNLILELVTANGRRHQRGRSHQAQLVMRTAPSRGRVPSYCPVVNEDRLEALAPWMPIINILYAAVTYDLTFRYAFLPSASNPHSRSWAEDLNKAISTKTFNYQRHLQAPSTLLDIVCPGKASIPEPPLTQNRPRLPDASNDPLVDPKLKSCPDNDPCLPPPRPSTPVKHRPAPSNDTHLTTRQKLHAKQNSVVHPEDTIMEDSDDDMFKSPVQKKQKPNLPSKRPPNEYIIRGKSLLHPAPNSPIDVTTAQSRWAPLQLRPHRPPTPYFDEAAIDPLNCLDEAGNEDRDVAEETSDGFFHSRKLNHHDWSLPNHNFPPGNNFTNNFSNQPGNVSLFQGYNQALAHASAAPYQDAFAIAMKEISSMIKANTELQERALEQSEAHHQDRENKRIAGTVRVAHLNAATRDGKTRAPRLTKYDEAYMKAKNPVESKDMIERDMQAKGCQVALTPHAGRVVHTGRWQCSRMAPGGLTILAMPVSLTNTAMNDFDHAQAYHDYEHGREQSNRTQRLLQNPTLIPPKTFHYLIDQLRNFCVALLLLCGQASIAYRAAMVWHDFMDGNKQYLMELASNGSIETKHLAIKIACQIHNSFNNSFNNWFIASTTGIPSPRILDCSLIMQQLMDGNAHISLPRAIEDLLQPPRRSNNNSSRGAGSSSQPSIADSNNSSRSSSNSNSNQRRLYKLAIAAAIQRNVASVPKFKDANGATKCDECIRYALLGSCDAGCTRAASHVPVKANSSRERSLASFRSQCGSWYTSNKSPNDPDFQGDGCDEDEAIVPRQPTHPILRKHSSIWPTEDEPPVAPTGLDAFRLHPLPPLLNLVHSPPAEPPFRSSFPALRTIHEDNEPSLQSIKSPRKPPDGPLTIRLVQHRPNEGESEDPPGIRATRRKRSQSVEATNPTGPLAKSIPRAEWLPGPRRDPEEDWFLDQDLVGLPIYSDPDSDIDSMYADESILDSHCSAEDLIHSASSGDLSTDDSDWSLESYTDTTDSVSSDSWVSTVSSSSIDVPSLATQVSDGSSDSSSIPSLMTAGGSSWPTATAPARRPDRPPPMPKTPFLLTPAMLRSDEPPADSTNAPDPMPLRGSDALTPRTSNCSFVSRFSNLATESPYKPRLTGKITCTPPSSISESNEPYPPFHQPPISSRRDPPGKSPPRSPSPERRPPAPPPVLVDAMDTSSASTPANPAPASSIEDDALSTSHPPPSATPVATPARLTADTPNDAKSAAIIASQTSILEDIQRTRHESQPQDVSNPPSRNPTAPTSPPLERAKSLSSASPLHTTKKPSRLFAVGTPQRGVSPLRPALGAFRKSLPTPPSDQHRGLRLDGSRSPPRQLAEVSTSTAESLCDKDSDWDGFFAAIRWVASAPVDTPSRSEFQFELTQSAAEHNARAIAAHDHDFASAIEANPGSIISPGSELRPFSQLGLLLGHHRDYTRFFRNSTEGIDYPAHDLPEPTRLEELHAQIIRGNHKSAMTADVASTVEKEMRDEAARGYAIPITKDCLLKLKGAELYPLGLAHQFTINEKGEQIPKRRVTHDLSNRKQFGLSINQRIDEDRIPETRYGHAMSRFVHLIHHIRYHHPDGRILMCKSDIEKAYRRLHTAPRIAAKCISAWETNELDDSGSMVKKFIGLLLTRLPFGSSPAPAEFSICSKRSSTRRRPPPCAPSGTPPPCRPHTLTAFRPQDDCPTKLPSDEPSQPTYTCPPSRRGVEGYIDDGAIAVPRFPIDSRMVDRARQALPMATHLVFRPVAEDDEPLPRPDPQSIRKLAAEGQLRESLVFLGWEINSRSLSIALPQEKASAWIASIEDALSRPTISWDDAKTLVGRLNHVGYIISSARHFLNRIRRLEYVANKHGRANFTIDARRDLALWILFLRRARVGLSMNLVVFRLPTTVGITDASEYGIGGYCLYSGRAWRYEFTKVEREAFSLNLKEFIGSVVNSKMLLPHDQCQYPCLLSLGDSSSATGWLHSSNFDPDLHPMHAEVAREHARVTMHHDACDYSQHLPGLHNVVADSLSRDFHLSHSKLTAMLYAAQPPYLPPQLSIVPLPPTIASWIDRWRRTSPSGRCYHTDTR